MFHQLFLTAESHLGWGALDFAFVGFSYLKHSCSLNAQLYENCHHHCLGLAGYRFEYYFWYNYSTVWSAYCEVLDCPRAEFGNQNCRSAQSLEIDLSYSLKMTVSIMNLKLLVLNFHQEVSPGVQSHCFGPCDWRPWAWLCSWPSEKPANCVHFPSQQTDHAGVQDQLSYNYFLIDLNFSSSFSFDIDFEPHSATECYCLLCFGKYFSIWLSSSAWAFLVPCFASVASMKQLQDHQGLISTIHMIADFKAPIFHHRTDRANDCYDSNWAS